MSNEFFYSVHGFGKDGFNVRLDKNLAKKLLDIKLSSDVYKKSKNSAIDKIIECGFSEEESNLEPYDFIYNSLLVNAFQVPGSRCQIHLEPSINCQLENSRNYFKYTTHNIDCIEQSSALLSIFVLWADYVQNL